MEIVSAVQEVDPAATESTSEIVRCGDEAQAEASAQLLFHLGQMLNDPALSDVKFVCNDGERVLASRIVLAGRSDVLKGMFMSGMRESNLSEIALPEISSPVLLSVFEFLYTGTLSKYLPQSWRMACEVIVASRFFLLPDLEKITRKVMHTITSGVAHDLLRAALLLTQAVELKPLCDEIDFNLMELVKILSSNWADAHFVWSLSEEAFHYLLENSKGNFDDDDKFIFREYLRFKQVIRWCISKSDETRWCVSKSDKETVEELVNSMVPDEQQALLLFNPVDPQKVDSLLKDASHSNELSLFHRDEKIRNLAIKLSSMIDFRKIHPVLLAKVVEPLNLISPTEIADSFRFHALRRTMIFKRRECDWEHGRSYSTVEQGFIIKKKDMGIGIAVSKTAILRSYGVYQWRFIVEERPATFCEFGFIYSDKGIGIEKPELQGKRLWEHPRARVLAFQQMQVTRGIERIEALTNWKGDTRHGGWEVISKSSTPKKTALFTFNASEGTCSLGFDNVDAGVVWNYLPKAVYYPAVSLGDSSAGRVRIQLISGFDFL